MRKLVIVLVILTSVIACDNKAKRQFALLQLETSKELLVQVTDEVNRLENQVVQVTGDLEVAKDDLIQIKEFQLLRTESEREQQIRSATEKKLKIEALIEELKSRVLTMKDSVHSVEAKILELKATVTD